MNARGSDARRIVVGLGIALVGFSALQSFYVFTALVALIACSSLYELTGLVQRKGQSLVVPIAYAGTLAYIVLAALGLLHHDEGWLLAATILGALAWSLFGAREGAFMRSAATMLAVLYIGKLLSYFIAIRRIAGDGTKLTVLAIFLIGMTDIFAMVVGRLIGKHPLSPISPRKTREGAVGGLIFALLAGLSIVSIDHLRWPIWQTLLIASTTSIAAQFGDLVESAFKRDALVKDAGSAFQGHGGVLDRFDSYLFGGIVFYAGLFLTGHLSSLGGP